MKILIIFNREPYDSTDVTCSVRCGIYKNHPYFDGAEKSTMPALAEWVVDSDKVLTF